MICGKIMGMYTRLVIDAELKHDTPTEMIEEIRRMIYEDVSVFARNPFVGTYGDNNYSKLTRSGINSNYKLESDNKIRNVNNSIQSLLDEILPWIERGLGEYDEEIEIDYGIFKTIEVNGFYAYTIFEDCDIPKFYHL